MVPKSSKRKFSTREIVIVAIFTAIAAILSFIEIPIMPAAPWLKYDPSGAVALICSFIFGPMTGGLVAVLSWIPRLLTNPVGAVMNILASCAFVIPAGLIYHKQKNMNSAVQGIILGLVCSVTLSILMNFIATPLYYGGSPADVLKMVLPILIPFNLIKLAAHSGISLIVYKPISNIAHKRKLDGSQK